MTVWWVSSSTHSPSFASVTYTEVAKYPLTQLTSGQPDSLPKSLNIYGRENWSHLVNDSQIGNTPLHEAILHRYIAIAATLIPREADINAIKSSGETPLHIASKGMRYCWFHHRRDLLSLTAAYLLSWSIVNDTQIYLYELIRYILPVTTRGLAPLVSLTSLDKRTERWLFLVSIYLHNRSGFHKWPHVAKFVQRPV